MAGFLSPANPCLFALVLFTPSTTRVAIVPLAGANIQKKGRVCNTLPSNLEAF